VGCGEGLFDRLSKFGEVEEEMIHPWSQRQPLAHQFISQPFSKYSQPTNRPCPHARCLRALPNHVLAPIRGALGFNGQSLITVPAFSCLWTTHDDLTTTSRASQRKSIGINVGHGQEFRYSAIFFIDVSAQVPNSLCAPKTWSFPEVPARNVNALCIDSILETAFSTVSLPLEVHYRGCTKR
jgi:hypothetical protein